MSEIRHEDVFRTIEPPPGGLTRLRARLDERAEPVPAWRARVAWMAAAAAGLAIVLRLAPAPESTPLERTPGLVRLGVDPQPRSAVSVAVGDRGEIAVLAVAETPGVVFYRIASLGPTTN